jgi:hypothetical protein
MRKYLLVGALLVSALAFSGSAAADRPGGGCVVDVSGVWQGVFEGQVIGRGEVTVLITQDHRRFHWTALASDLIFASGDGTIAAGPMGDVNAQIMGSGGGLKKIDAHGAVTYADVGDQMDVGLTADFTYDAIYVSGLHESGTVKLVHVIPQPGD